MTELKCGAGNVHNTAVVAIPLEEFAAERKKIRGGQAVILEDDRFGNMLEDPIEASRKAYSAAQIVVGIVSHHLARPVDPFRYRAGRFA